LTISNRGADPAAVRVVDRYDRQTTKFVLEAGETDSKHWSLQRTRGWYDLTITIGGDARFEYHLEDGEDSISDPIMGGLVR
jgi:phospholipase C